MWVGVDDTDSVRGGCTTHVLTELVASARDRGIDLIGLPRLVRLNPNIPWKTRGNAALSARFGHGTGRPQRIGWVRDEPTFSYPSGRELSGKEAGDWFVDAWKVVRASSRSDEAGTDPALVALARRPPASFYWKAVREIVPVRMARETISELRGEYRTLRSERGLVGAVASIAWPGRRRTFELLSYRRPEAIARPRTVDAASVRRAQQVWPSLFLCYDPGTRRLLVTPHTPCPILFGLRGRAPTAILRARTMVRSEPVDRWLLFATNQGTGDHLRPLRADQLVPFTSAIVRGRVASRPVVGPGGHVRFTLVERGTSETECIAFEPTKTLPKVVRRLDVGDLVRVWGSRKRDPVLRLEGIEVIRWNPRRGPQVGPLCSTCRRRAHSLGRQRGYICRGCGRRWPPEAGRARRTRPPFPRGVFHPTPSARRHLAPLGPEAPMSLVPVTV